MPPSPESWPAGAQLLFLTWRRGGWVGVDLFFVLSGFLVSALLFTEYKSRGNLGVGRFYLRRAWRIYPPFIVLIAASVIIWLGQGWQVPSVSLASELFFLQSYLPGLWSHTWSLAVEEHFYLLLPLTLALMLRWNQNSPMPLRPILRLAAGVAVAALAARLINWYVRPSYGNLTHLFASHLRLDSLFFGVAISYAYHFHSSRFHRLFTQRRRFLIFGGALLLTPAFAFRLETTPFLYTIGFTIFCVGSGMMLVGILLSQIPHGPVLAALATLGKYSYSIYLWHLFVLAWGIPVIEGTFAVELGAGTRLAMYFVGTFGFGILMAKAVEVPALRLRDRWFPSRSPGIAIFPPDELIARRAQVFEQIGDGVAIVLGTAEPLGELPFRQNCQFFYLTGVTVPRASVIIDGRARTTTMFLQPRTESQDTSQSGPGINPGAAAATALGVQAVLDRVQFASASNALASAGRVIYTPFAAEALGNQSHGNRTRDGRDSHQATFIANLAAAAPDSEIKDLDPIVNALRAVKSPREIAIIREATRISGEGIMAAMREARVGMHEHELQAPAEFIFTKNGALGASDFALIATGRNTYYTHYNRNTSVLADGDLVQFDYAPDFKYYQSDVTRVFPANGTFSARQREMYEIYLELYQSVLTSIQVHATPADCVKNALVKMDAIMVRYQFTDARIKAAAVNMVEGYRSRQASTLSLGHNVGLELHDVGGRQPTFEPGQVFTIEPQFRIEEEHLGIRLEDMLLITETGVENLSAFVPISVAEIEKLMREPGLSATLNSD